MQHPPRACSPARDRSQILHPTSPGRRQSHGRGRLAGGQGGHLAEAGAQARGTEGCAGAGGDPRRRNTYNRPRGHPYKNKSHLLRGRGSPAALCTQLWRGPGWAPHRLHQAPHGFGDKSGGHRAPGSCCEPRGSGQPPEALQGLRAPLGCLGRGVCLRSVQGSILGFKSLGPSPGAQPHSSGQPQGTGVRVLASEPGPVSPASPAGHREPRSLCHALSLFSGAASLPLCAAVAPRPSRAGDAPVLASARGSGSARGASLASGGVGPLAAG